MVSGFDSSKVCLYYMFIVMYVGVSVEFLILV